MIITLPRMVMVTAKNFLPLRDSGIHLADAWHDAKSNHPGLYHPTKLVQKHWLHLEEPRHLK